MKNIEYICGVCNVLCQTPALLDRHNTSVSHIKVLKKYNVFPTLGLKEFSLEYFLQPAIEIQPGKHHLYKEDKRHWCKICCTASNDLINLHQHNGGKKHKNQLLELGLPLEHGEFDYCEKFVQVPCYNGNCDIIIYEEPLVGFSMIEDFRAQGISIPKCVRRVLKVQAQYKLSQEEMFNFNLDEAIQCFKQIEYSTVLIENDTIIGILTFDDIPLKECTIIEEISRGIFNCGGEVKRSPAKRAGQIVMCGWRRDMDEAAGALDEFGR